MGLFDGIARRKAQKKYDEDLVTHKADLADWEDADKHIDSMLEVVRDCVTGPVENQFQDHNNYGFMLDNPIMVNINYVTIPMMIFVITRAVRWRLANGVPVLRAAA